MTATDGPARSGLSAARLAALEALGEPGPDLVMIFCAACGQGRGKQGRSRRAKPAASISRHPQGLLLHSERRENEAVPRQSRQERAEPVRRHLCLLLDALDLSELDSPAALGCPRHGRLQTITFRELLADARGGTPRRPLRRGVPPLAQRLD